jgi:hypothetical protein
LYIVNFGGDDEPATPRSFFSASGATTIAADDAWSSERQRRRTRSTVDARSPN